MLLNARFRKTHLAWLPLAIVGLWTIAGCGNQGPEMVSVRGKVTLQGGPWPRPGIVNFTPVKAAEGLPSKPASGRFDVDGSFVATTGEYSGLIPGEYRVSVTCWLREPGDNDPGQSYTPESFTNPARSGLELKIPRGSGPVIWEKDLPRLLQ